MTKKRLVASLLVVLLVATLAIIFVGCTVEKSIEVPEVKQDVYVYDQDDCIDNEIEMEINAMLKELEEKTEAEFAVISISSLNDYTIEEYAYELFNTLGIGKEDADNGVLLLFSKSDSKVRLEIGRGLEGCLNDAKCGRILDDYFVTYREEGDYTQAAKNTAIAVINEIAEEYQVDLENVGEAKRAGSEENKVATWVYIVIFTMVVVFCLMKALADGDSSGGYYGGHSGGGGFGGGHSSGFGGGRSGGGGASR